jgi:hypothetical protein
MNLNVVALAALSTLALGSVAQAESKLDYDKLSGYLKQTFGSLCKDETSNTGSSTSCQLEGVNGHSVPWSNVSLSKDKSGVYYTLEERVEHRTALSALSTANDYYLKTLGRIDEWGRPMTGVVPNIEAAVNFCFSKSELGKGDQINCRTTEKITEKLGVSFWGQGGSQYYGYKLIIQAYKLN